MRASTWIVLFAVLGFAAGVGATLGLQWLYDQGGFLADAWNSATRPPRHVTKTLIVVTILIVFSAIPVAIAEWVGERRFVKAEREMRAARPDDAVTRYEGPEGRGFLFDGPAGRALLLEPAGGIGEPRVVELPPVPAAPPEPPAPPIEAVLGEPSTPREG